MVKVLPLTRQLTGRFTKHGGHEKGADEDGDLPKVCGFGGPERRADPFHVLPIQSKLHFFELVGIGEVK